MKCLMLRFVFLVFFSLETYSWADRVQWDHFSAKENDDVKLGLRAFDDTAQVSLVELDGAKGQLTNGISYLCYRLVATTAGKETVIWSRPVLYSRDWLRGWSCAFNAEKRCLGLVTLGQRTTCFFEIPLNAANAHAHLVREVDATAVGETSIALNDSDRLECIQKLGSQFRHISAPVDALLESEVSNWILHLKFRQPRRAKDGNEIFEPGVEDEMIDAVFTRAVSGGQADWKLSSVTRESLQEARCRHTLSEIDANKKAWYKKHAISSESSLDTQSFLKEYYEGELPHCPEGGKYTLSTFSEPTTCSIHGTYTSRQSFSPQNKRKFSDKRAE